MADFVKTLRQSFEIFVANPKFIAPKLVMAFFYSVLLLMTADLSLSFVDEASVDLLIPALILLGATFVVGIIDIFAGAMYPPMVKDIRSGKKAGLKKALSDAFDNCGVVLPSVIFVEIAFVVLIFFISLPLSFLIVSDESYFLLTGVVYAVILCAMVFLFYLLYPVIIYEKKSVSGSIKRSVGLSMKNKAGVGKATALSLLLSLASYALAFSIEMLPSGIDEGLFWLAFIIVRVLTAYVYAYLYVLNPVFYLDNVKAVK